MREKSKRRLLLFLCILATCCLTACAAPEPQPTEITLIHGWGSIEDDHVVMRQIYSNFSKANPDVQINLVSMPTSAEAARKAEDRVLVGKTPDIIFLGGGSGEDIYAFMVQNHLALDMMPYLKGDPTFMQCIAPANLEYWTTTDGGLYNISDVLSLSGGYWYNQEILQAAGVGQIPQTWAEFEALCEAVNAWALREQNGVKALQPSAEGYLYFLDHLLSAEGMTLRNHQIAVDDGQMANAFQVLQRLYDQSLDGDGRYSYLDEISLFNEGKLAICVNGVWGAPMIDEGKEAAYALIPSSEGSTSCISAGLGFVLGKTGDPIREEASIRFVRYMLSPEVQTRILQETQQVSANPTVPIQQYAALYPRFFQAVEIVQAADRRIEIPNLLWTNRQFAIFQENLFSVFSGQLKRQTLFDLL